MKNKIEFLLALAYAKLLAKRKASNPNKMYEQNLIKEVADEFTKLFNQLFGSNLRSKNKNKKENAYRMLG